MLDAISDWSLTEWWPIRAPALVLTFVAAVLLVWWGRRWWSRCLLALVIMALLPVNVLTALNAYYGYLPTIGQALGNDGRDTANLAVLDSHERRSHGEVVTLPIPAPAAKTHSNPAKVYLPPAWFQPHRPKLPVYMLINGVPGGPDSWTKSVEIAAALDGWAASHDGFAPVVVMPDANNGQRLNDTECVDSPHGNMETYLSRDVPAFVEHKFGTQPPGRAWGVAGYSAGGMCSLMLTLRHPKLFNTFVDMGGLSGPRVGESDSNTGSTTKILFGGSKARFLEHEPSTLLKKHRFDDIGGWFQQGTADGGPLRAANKLAVLTRAAGIDTRIVTIPNAAHTFILWRQAFRDSLGWVVGRLVSQPPNKHDENGTCPSCTIRQTPPAKPLLPRR